MCKKYRMKHKEELKKKAAEYFQKNKKIIRQKDKIKKRFKYKNDLVYRLGVNIRSRVRGAFKNNYKSEKTLSLLGCTVNELKEHLENQFGDGMSWDNYGFYGWHIDHIKQLSLFDLTNVEEQKKAFHYTNLRPLWGVDNMSRPKINKMAKVMLNG